MTDKQKNTKGESRDFCKGMPFAEMMRKMMDQEGRCCGPDGAEMIRKVMSMCCGPTDENEKTAMEEKKR